MNDNTPNSNEYDSGISFPARFDLSDVSKRRVNRGGKAAAPPPSTAARRKVPRRGASSNLI